MHYHPLPWHSVPWGALTPLIVVYVLSFAYPIYDMVRHPLTRQLPRWAWVLICLSVTPFGGIAYLVLGRSEDR